LSVKRWHCVSILSMPTQFLLRVSRLTLSI